MKTIAFALASAILASTAAGAPVKANTGSVADTDMHPVFYVVAAHKRSEENPTLIRKSDLDPNIIITSFVGAVKRDDTGSEESVEGNTAVPQPADTDMHPVFYVVAAHKRSEEETPELVRKSDLDPNIIITALVSAVKRDDSGSEETFQLIRKSDLDPDGVVGAPILGGRGEKRDELRGAYSKFADAADPKEVLGE